MIGRDIATTYIWFQPLFAWLGLLTLISLLTTASYGYMLVKGKVRKVKIHLMLASTTIVIALVHGYLALTTLI